jgi:formylglycine-generating enzyme required for sulfatase activity
LLWQGYNRKASPTVDCPIQSASWVDALLFCNWLSRKEGRQPCYGHGGKGLTAPWQCDFEADGYRLPTDAEWEYVCRAGTTTLFPIGSQPDFLRNYANLELMKTLPGGSRLPNDWGFFDLIGNVWEFCWDPFGLTAASPVTDPHGKGEGQQRVMRGGGFGAGSYYARSALRLPLGAQDRGGTDGSHGFRVVCGVRKGTGAGEARPPTDGGRP